MTLCLIALGVWTANLAGEFHDRKRREVSFSGVFVCLCLIYQEIDKSSFWFVGPLSLSVLFLMILRERLAS